MKQPAQWGRQQLFKQDLLESPSGDHERPQQASWEVVVYLEERIFIYPLSRIKIPAGSQDFF